MEENNKDIKDTEEKDTETADEVDFTAKTGLIKKIFIFLLILIFVIFGLLFSLQNFIKLEDAKNENNIEISKILIEENNKINPDKNKVDSSDTTYLKINGKVSFKSFPMPYVLINDIQAKDLVEDNYLVDFNIEKIKLFLSPSYLLKKQFVVNGIEVINGNFNIQELNQNIGVEEINLIASKYFEKITKNYPNIKIVLNNNSIIIKAIKYQRELTNINISGTFSQNKLSLLGKLTSNKQPLNIDLNLKKDRDDFSGKINLNSQAFVFNTTIKANLKDLKFSGNSDLNLINPQLFSRTIFSTSDFLYKRVIDNTPLNVNFKFKLENDILSIENIVFEGSNLKANGKAEFNFIADQKNNVEFDIKKINLDALIIKNIVNKNANNIKEDDISIFSGAEVKKEENGYKGFIESRLKINPTFFNIKLKEINFNQDKINDVELDFSYNDSYKYKFNKVIGKFPAETNLTIENKDDKQLLNIKGEDIDGFWNFIKNSIGTYSSKTSKDKKTKFSFDGVIKIDGYRLFINNGIFSIDNLKTENTIEIKFDSGISFLAIDTKIKDLKLDNFVSLGKNNSPYIYTDTLKNKILFLNTFALNTFLKFNIENIQYKDFKDNNYNFTIRTSQGVLDIYDINLNDKIKGEIILDISKLKPNMNIKLNLENIEIKNNIDLNKILFDIPTLEDFYGNININGNNILFKNSQINTFEILTNLKNGTINLDKFEIDGFGGQCKINGFLELQYSKKLNLTFGGCTADLKDLLYLFTGTDNIDGKIGFSSVLYAEGQNKENFIQSYIMKLQMVGSGINVDKFGLGNLSSDLFAINTDEDLLNSIKPEEVLYNKNNNTVFEKMPKGSIKYSKKSGGQFDFDLSKTMINGKVSGKFKLFSNYTNIELNSNFVMLSGTLEKTIPLNLAIAINGNTNEKFGIATNFQNIESYISSVKVQFEEFKKQQEEEKLKRQQEKLKENQQSEEPIN